MSERIMLLIISLLITVSCLAIGVWTFTSGQIATMDGKLLFAVCLVLALIFSMNARSLIPKQKLREWIKRQRAEASGREQHAQAPK